MLPRIDLIYGDLNQLSNLAERLQLVRSDEDNVQHLKLRSDVSKSSTRIQKTLDNLPAYCMTADRGELSLQKQRQRSERLSRWLLYGTGIVVAVSIVILTCIFQWISDSRPCHRQRLYTNCQR